MLYSQIKIGILFHLKFSLGPMGFTLEKYLYVDNTTIIDSL